MRVCPAQDRHSLRHNHALGSPLPARSGLSANPLGMRPAPGPAGSLPQLYCPLLCLSQGLCLRGGLFHISSIGALFPDAAVPPPLFSTLPPPQQGASAIQKASAASAALPETKKSPAAQKRQGTKSRTAYGPLDHAGDDVHAFTAQHGDGRHFDERMAAGLQAGRGASS